MFQDWQIHGSCRIHLPTWHKLCFRAGRSMGLAEFTCQHDRVWVSGLADPWDWQNSPANMTQIVFQGLKIHGNCGIHLSTWHRLYLGTGRSLRLPEVTCQLDADCLWSLVDSRDWQHSSYLKCCFRAGRSMGLAEITWLDCVSGLADPWDWQNSPANYPVFSTFQSSSPHTR